MCPAQISTAAARTAPLLARAADLLRARRPGDAIVPLREAARLQPLDSNIQHDLGLACLECGLVSDAIAALQSAVASNPRFAKGFLRLGVALEANGDTIAAIAAYCQAADLLPSLIEAHYRAGCLYESRGHRADALGRFRRAAASAPKSGFGRLSAAKALLAEDRDQEAERVLRQTLALDRDNAAANDLLGLVLADAGRFAEARDCYDRATAQAPLLAGSYYDLVRCRPVTAADTGLLARMQVAVANPGLDAGQRLRVHLALGKAADDLGDYAEAMRRFDAAHELRRCLAKFNLGAFEAQVECLIAQFTPDLIAQAPRLGCDDATPVLILGMPRSGTTLVEHILSSHPDASAGGELHFWNERGARWQRENTDAGRAEFLSEAASDYMLLLRTIAPNAAKVSDKMPFNFIWAGLIHLALPRATIIHCRRNPIDTALSIHQTHFNPHLHFPTGGSELVAYSKSYRRLTEHWRQVLPADRFIEIDYEELAAEPEPIIRHIVAGCGLPWNDKCLYPEHNAHIIRTPSKWQARQPIYRTAVARWRRYEPWLGPLADLLDLNDSSRRRG